MTKASLFYNSILISCISLYQYVKMYTENVSVRVMCVRGNVIFINCKNILYTRLLNFFLIITYDFY